MLSSAINLRLNENRTFKDVTIKGSVTTVDDAHPIELKFAADTGDDEIASDVWKNLKNVSDHMNEWDKIGSDHNEEAHSADEDV